MTITVDLEALTAFCLQYINSFFNVILLITAAGVRVT